jgi:hypothetical protein
MVVTLGSLVSCQRLKVLWNFRVTLEEDAVDSMIVAVVEPAQRIEMRFLEKVVLHMPLHSVEKRERSHQTDLQTCLMRLNRQLGGTLEALTDEEIQKQTKKFALGVVAIATLESLANP